ncbi:hypothetical protein B0T20DRAFT_404029 [Sordaria brevicollis]|uniref:Uncharacterized protein n=1 Tax=Sordaria brevicollis TaxID=83679 RepID=A0AAE0PM20_SORBR|nr:hypothetical protein B0T20DRAFT_404029 [Sordaria brevicollis]
MKLLPTTFAIAIGTILAPVVTSSAIRPIITRTITAHPSKPTEKVRGSRVFDLNDYHLSRCTQLSLPHTARAMTGIDHNDDKRQWSHCAFISPEGDNEVDYECLCRGGDGEGSAIIDVAILTGHLMLDRECGWGHSFDVVFPETVEFCRKVVSGSRAHLPLVRRGRIRMEEGTFISWMTLAIATNFGDSMYSINPSVHRSVMQAQKGMSMAFGPIHIQHNVSHQL